MARDYFKQVNEYIDGKLTGSELSDFLKEMNRNPELSKEVELCRKQNKQPFNKAEDDKEFAG